jgi:transposase InsO family protein
VADAHITDALLTTVGDAEGMYGRRNMTAYLRRNGHQVARCRVDRLMRDEGLSGIVRGTKHRTTIAGGADSRRPRDLLDRDFTASAPNRKWVTDFTYVPTWSGFIYVALVIDCFSRAIVGWQVCKTKDTAMVTTALKMALWRRDHYGHAVGDGLIHHSDAGSQYTSIAFAEALVLEGITASIGSVGDAYDNSLARRQSGCSRPRPSALATRSAQGRSRHSPTSSTPQWSRSTGTTTSACTVSWTTSHPRNTRAPTTLNSGGPSRRCLKHEAGIKPGPVHCNVRRGFFLYAVRAVSRATVGRSKLSRSSTNTAGNV